MSFWLFSFSVILLLFLVTDLMPLPSKLNAWSKKESSIAQRPQPVFKPRTIRVYQVWNLSVILRGVGALQKHTHWLCSGIWWQAGILPWVFMCRVLITSMALWSTHWYLSGSTSWVCLAILLGYVVLQYSTSVHRWIWIFRSLWKVSHMFPFKDKCKKSYLSIYYPDVIVITCCTTTFMTNDCLFLTMFPSSSC